MDGRGIDAITRRAAAAITRRTSLIALAVAALTASSTPRTTEAGGRCRKRIKKLCAEFELDCRQMVVGYCSLKYPNPNQINEEQACEAKLRLCCPDFSASCNVRDGMGCLLANSLSV